MYLTGSRPARIAHRRMGSGVLAGCLVLGGMTFGQAAAHADVIPGQSCGSYALSAPAGGRALTVAQDGTGAFTTIAAAAAAARAGDTVTIKSGTYAESVRVAGSGTAAQPIVFQAATCGGAVLTGAGNTFQGSGYLPDQGGPPQATNPYVVVRGLDFVDFGTAVSTYHDAGAVNMTLGWRLENVYLRNSGGWASVNVRGNDTSVDRTSVVAAPYDALFAIGACCNTAQYGAAGQLKRLRVTNTLLDGNNTGRNTPNWEAVTKFMQTDDLVIDNVESSNNNGAGLWLDWDNYHYTISNSHFHHNIGVDSQWQGVGLELEIYSDDGVVANNRFDANSGPDLLVSSSSRVDVHGNLFQGSSTDGFSQIEFHRGLADGTCWRPEPTGVRVTNNQFLDFGGQWQWAAITTTSDPSRSYTCPQSPSPVTAGHWFNSNTYRKAAYSGALVTWEAAVANTTGDMAGQWGYETGTAPVTTSTTVAPTTTTVPAPTTTTTVQAPGDTRAPTVTSLTPPGGSPIGRSVSISATATDNVAVTTMQLYIDGVARTSSSGGSLSYTWNATRTGAGAHTIMVRAIDRAGNAGQTSVVVYK